MDILSLLEQCSPQVAPTTLQRIISVESRGHPNLIGTKVRKNGKVYTLNQQPVNQEEAINWATWLYKQGYQFDAGIAQVNSRHFAEFGLTPKTVFDPCVNVRVGGKILTQFYVSAQKHYGDEQKALLAAVSAYNSGNFKTGFSNGYVSKFIRQTLPIPKGEYAWNQFPLLKSFKENRAHFFEQPTKAIEETLNPYLADAEVKGFQ